LDCITIPNSASNRDHPAPPKQNVKNVPIDSILLRIQRSPPTDPDCLPADLAQPLAIPVNLCPTRTSTRNLPDH
jgi:hypothetical protein